MKYKITTHIKIAPCHLVDSEPATAIGVRMTFWFEVLDSRLIHSKITQSKIYQIFFSSAELTNNTFPIRS